MSDTELVGLRKFAGNMEKIKGKTRESVADAMVLTVLNIERQSRQNAPVRSGMLKAGYHSEYNKSAIEGVVYTDVLYAPFVEFGTSRMAAQPHFTPAVVDNIGFFSGSVERAMKKGMS